MIRRIGLGLIVGLVITSIPWLVGRLDNEALWPVNFLYLPGAIVALIFSGGKIHDYNFTLLLSANVLSYALGIFLWLRPKRRLDSN